MVVRCAWSVTLSLGLEAQSSDEVGEASVLFSPKLIAVFSSASTANHALSDYFVVSLLMGPLFRKKINLEVGLRVYTKAVEVAKALGAPVLIPQILFRGLLAGVLPLL